VGPPGCGKSTLLRALSGQLDKSLKVQIVLLIQHEKCVIFSSILYAPSDITVRETLDFSAQCQGVGSRAGNSF